MLAVPGVAAGGQRSPAAFDVGGGHVGADEAALGEVLPGELGLDAGLALQEPVQGFVEVVWGEVPEWEGLAEGVGVEAAGGGQLGAGLEDAGGDQGDGEVAEARGLGIEEGLQAEQAQGAEDGGDMAVREGPLDAEGLGQAGDGGAALEQGAEVVDERLGPRGEVRQGAFADFAVCTEGLAEEHGRRRVAVGDTLDIQGYSIN